VSAEKTILWINQFAVTPDQGGGTRHFELSRELVRRGWKVFLVASDLNLQTRAFTKRANHCDKKPVIEKRDGVKIFWLWAAPYQKNNWKRLWNWLSFMFSSEKLFRELPKVDLVIGSSPQPLAALAGLRFSQVRGIPFWLEIRDVWPDSLEAATGKKGRLFYGLLKMLFTYLYSRADKIIHLAEGTARLLAKGGVPKTKFIFLPNGADVSQFPEPRRASQEEHTSFVYLGTHGPANGLETLVEAAGMVGPKSGISFHLIGDGPAKKNLQILAKDLGCRHLEFHPVLSKQEAIQQLRKASAGLMILRDEPLFQEAVSPNKLFDYMAAGLPVVGNVRGEVGKIIQEAAAGLVARDGSAQALATTIREFSNLPSSERDRMGNAGRQWMLKNRDRAVLAENLHLALTEALQP